MSNIYVPPGGELGIDGKPGLPRAIGIPPPDAAQYGSVWLSLSCDSLHVSPKSQVVRAYVNVGHAGAANWQPLYRVCPAKPDGSGFDDASGMFGPGATVINSTGRRFGSLPKGTTMLSILPYAFPLNPPDENVGVDVMVELYPHGQ